jgi:hypothetical protein
MNGATFMGDVILREAKVGGQLSMVGSIFERTVNGNGMTVASSLFMRDDATFKGDVDLVGAKIGGTLDLHASRLLRIDLSDATIAQELVLGGEGEPAIRWLRSLSAEIEDQTAATGWPLGNPGWRNSAANAGAGADDPPPLILRNAQAGALQDSADAWPSDLDLEGFKYDRLGGFAGTQTADMRKRSPAEWADWFARDRTFSTQPYSQLAAVLLAAGHRDTAEAVQFAARDRERTELWDLMRQQLHAFREAIKAAREPELYGQVIHKLWAGIQTFGTWLWLTSFSAVAGYGIGLYTFRVLWWILGLTVLGAAVLWYSPYARGRGVLWRLGASLHRLLPVVELSKEFKDFFDNPSPKYPTEPRNLTPLQVAFFSGLALLGWVLGLFLLAAITGLTPKG